ncbi:MAG: DUF3305 domain-containing protein [Betaproteobacteria bacterium]
MQKPTFPIAVIMQRRPSRSPWANHVWEPLGVVPGFAAGEKRQLLERDGMVQWLHPGFVLTLHRDEAEGYYLNVSSSSPRVFVLWRMEADEGLPVEVTVSSEEASRWMDGGHQIDSVAMPAEVFAWVGEWVENNYRPKREERIKPRSFRHPKDRV